MKDNCIGFRHTSTWITHRSTYVSSLLNLPPTSHPIPLQNFLNKQIVEEKVDKLDFIKIRTSDLWKIPLRKFLKNQAFCRLRKNKPIHISHNRLESLKEHVKDYLYHLSLDRVLNRHRRYLHRRKDCSNCLTVETFECEECYKQKRKRMTYKFFSIDLLTNSLKINKSMK